MQNDKSLTVKRIIIFLILTFVPAYFFEIVTVDKDTEGYLTSVFGGSSLMLYPAIANVLTRLITKEGFGKTYLRINFKGNFKYYLIGALFPIINGILAGAIFSVCYIHPYSFSENIDEAGGMTAILASILMLIDITIAELFMGFGEEFGWRAYLTPKLETLMPSPLAICVNGIIWALWHAPLITLGYDWGTNYPFFPYLGILSMCVACIFISMIFTYITKKTDSVWPAALSHTVVDVIMSTISVIIIGVQNEEIFNQHDYAYPVIGMIICPLIISIPMMFSMFRKNLQNKA